LHSNFIETECIWQIISMGNNFCEIPNCTILLITHFGKHRQAAADKTDDKLGATGDNLQSHVTLFESTQGEMKTLTGKKAKAFENDYISVTSGTSNLGLSQSTLKCLITEYFEMCNNLGAVAEYFEMFNNRDHDDTSNLGLSQSTLKCLITEIMMIRKYTEQMTFNINRKLPRADLRFVHT
jgi:hypothetical protein